MASKRVGGQSYAGSWMEHGKTLAEEYMPLRWESALC